MSLMKRLTIGSLSLKSSAILSPLEGVSDIGFRSLCARNGAGLVWTEMVRAQAVIRNNASTLDLIDTYDESSATGLQLLAKSAEELTKCLSTLDYLSNNFENRSHFKNIVAIDLNFGCPSPDIINEGAGPSLLKRKKKLREIFAALVNWKNSNSLGNIKAVGCKIRLGLNISEQNNKIYMGVIEAANEAGLDYVTVHARHAKQRSSDQPTWNAITEIKDFAKMPVIGNGNVSSLIEAKRMMDMTNCDGVMIARAAIRNPWIFRHFNTHENTSNQVQQNEIDTEYWPTVEEVQHEISLYSKISNINSSKSKYVTFHENNFRRLLTIAQTGNTDLPTINPRTIHFV